MLEPRLWVRFLGDQSASEARPTLWLTTSEGVVEIALHDRSRRLIGAIAVPRDLATRSSSKHPELSMWPSQDIVERIHGDRSTLSRAIEDLERDLKKHDLELATYLYSDKDRGLYALKEAHVDVVELLLARGTPEKVDQLLADVSDSPGRVGLATANKALFSQQARTELDAIVSAADERLNIGAEPNRVAAELPEIAAGTEADRPTDRSPPAWHGQHRRTLIAIVAAVAAVSAATIALLASGDSGSPRTKSNSNTANAVGRVEVAGGTARTWSDYKNASGKNGKPLEAGDRVLISCRVKGFKVQDGDIWWYRLASSPWSNRFYATADAFYNNGRTEGTLKGTLKVDRLVPGCP